MSQKFFSLIGRVQIYMTTELFYKEKQSQLSLTVFTEIGYLQITLTFLWSLVCETKKNYY